MAVESKQGGTPTNGAGAVPNGAASKATLGGTGAAGAAGTGANPVARRRRSSSLMQNATSLPTVEHSLEEFIAKANQTLVDVSGWGNADQESKAEEGKRREQDAQRWKQAETQMRESEAREQSLRRQLDGLQGKLAEAEARAAVAGTQVGSAAHDSTISDLKTQIDNAMQRMRASEERSSELAHALASAKAEVHARPATPVSGGGFDEDEADERVRLAEAKAAKAIAAARAAQAGLTVSSADLAAIESGLVVVDPPARKSPWLGITLAFVGGLGIMFAVWKFALSDNQAPATQAAGAVQTPAQPVVQPVAPAEPAVTPAVTPTVTPIDDQVQPAAVDVAPTVTPIDEPAAAAPVAVDEPAAAVKAAEPVGDDPPAKATKKAATKKAATKKAATKKAATKPALADPFADPPAKKPAKNVEKKPAGGIVDPF